MLAHRGLAVGAPEGTRLAFLKALAAGAPYLEVDVRASRDGVAVVWHDDDLLRLAGRADLVADLSFAQLSAVDLGVGQRICSLAALLDTFPEARLNIDIKSAGAVRPTVTAIRAARAVDRVLITSFSERRRSAAVGLLTGVATSASSSRAVVAVIAAKLGLLPAMRLALRDIQAVQLPVRSMGVTVATRRMVERFHAVGVEMHTWTVNDRATMERLLDMGIDGIVTDRADVAARLVLDRPPQKR